MCEPRTVLVIDDDRDIVRAMTLRLRAAGYVVRTADDGETGLAAARSEPPDVVLLDIRMPGMDGLELLAALRTAPVTKHLPVIVVSANLNERTRARALELGVRYFIAKPYQAAQLISAIETVLRAPDATCAASQEHSRDC